MSVKELTKITLTDLRNEYNCFGDFWEKEEAAAREFRQKFIERALDAERMMLIGCKPLLNTI